MSVCGAFVVGPGHEFVDAGGWPAVDELGQRIGEPGVRVDGIELGGLDQRDDDRTVGTAFVAAGEECVLPVQGDGTDRAFDRVGVDLDAAIVEEAAEVLSVARAVTHGLSTWRAAREAFKLLVEPDAKRLDERLRSRLPICAASLADRPDISASIAYSWPMRRRALLAIGVLPALAMS